MKKISTPFLIAIAVFGSFGLLSFKPVSSPSILNATYDAQFVSTQQMGTNYEWIWTVTNPNPGNGNNGTLQNLSHWSLAISDLVTINDLVEVAYSTDGSTWSTLPVSFAIDKSQDCYRGTVLKFDHGTSGTAATWYKLVVNKDFTTGFTMANFKSGNTTGCYNGTVMGIGTPIEEGGNDR